MTAWVMKGSMLTLYGEYVSAVTPSSVGTVSLIGMACAWHGMTLRDGASGA